MPPMCRGRPVNRAPPGLGRGSRNGRLCQDWAADGGDRGALVPPANPTTSGNLAAPAGFDPRKLEELITEGIAKGVELGIAKALSVVEATSGTVSTPVTGSGMTTQTPAAQRSSSVTLPASVNQSTPSVGHDASVSSASPSIEMHSITASSLPPQIPGRPGLDATVSADALDHLVPQRVKDKIWAKEYVDLSTLLQEEDQEMELQISSHSAQPTFTLGPKNKKEVNMIARWIKAFNCFTAVYSQKWPEEVPGLLKHMDIVIGLADDNANWRYFQII